MSGVKRAVMQVEHSGLRLIDQMQDAAARASSIDKETMKLCSTARAT
jgi:hypothetical protein